MFAANYRRYQEESMLRAAGRRLLIATVPPGDSEGSTASYGVSVERWTGVGTDSSIPRGSFMRADAAGRRATPRRSLQGG